MSETPLGKQVELDACQPQLSLPPKKLQQGTEQRGGVPTQDFQTLVSWSPSHSHSQEPSLGHSEVSLPRDVTYAPAVSPTGLHPLCMYGRVSLCPRPSNCPLPVFHIWACLHLGP